jgi:hypothetical protein
VSFDEEPDGDPHGECAAEIHRLQRALAFWMPMVPAADSPAISRLADDTFLLAGYQGEPEKCAQELGWIFFKYGHRRRT